MASEAAKKLAAEQKAEVKAAKLRKKNSDNPADWGQIRQMREVFRVTRENDKAAVWFMLGGFVAGVTLFTVLGLLWLKPWWMWTIIGVLAGLVAALYILSWRAKIAMFARYKGQPGSAEVGLNLLPKTWSKTPAITINRHQDIVHRAVGPGGIVLVGEGSPGRVRAMLDTETKRHESIKYAVPVTPIVLGDADNQVSLEKLDKYIKKLPKVIKASQIAEIQSRLKALDGARPRIPVPKGPMPSMKGARSAMRGR